MKTLFRILLCSCLVSILLLGCSKLKGKKVIKLYTSIPTEQIKKIEDRFETKYPGINLEVDRRGSSALEALIKVEMEKPSGLQADIIWPAEPSFMERLKEKKVLKQYTSSETAKVLPEFKDAENYYFGARLINVVIVCNTSIVPESERPKEWKDLLAPKWKDSIAIPDPIISSAAMISVISLTKKYGWEYYTGLKDNGAVVLKSNKDVTEAIASGKYKVGIVLDYYPRAQAANKEGKPTSVMAIYPNDGVVAVPSPIAITSTSKNYKYAKLFVDYILSVEGQQSLVDENYFFPVRVDVNPPAGAPISEEVAKKAGTMQVDWNYVNEVLIPAQRTFNNLLLR